MAALRHLVSNFFPQESSLKFPCGPGTIFPTDIHHKTALELQAKANYDAFYYQPTEVCNLTSM